MLLSADLSGNATWVQKQPSRDTVAVQTSCPANVDCSFSLLGHLSPFERLRVIL